MPGEEGKENMPTPEQQPKEGLPERGESPMEREQRIRKLVEEKPIMGGQGPKEEKPKVDIGSLIEAEVKARVAGIEGEVGTLRAGLDAAKAEVEVLRDQNKLLTEGLKGTFDKVVAEMSATRAAVEKTARAGEATSEFYRIPEDERPKDRQDWINLIRGEISRLRKLGEPPYSQYLWYERPEVKRILVSVSPKEKDLLSALISEVWVTQREDKLYTQWRHGARKLDALGELIDIAPQADLMLTPEILNRLSKLPEAEVPSWLEEIIRPKERNLSVQMSRGVYLYTKFFGEWAETMAKKLDEPGGIEEQGRERWRKGEFGKDKKKWGKWVGDQLRDIDWAKEKEMQELNREVLEKLGFGDKGIIPYSVLKQIFEKVPPELKINPTFMLMELQVSRVPEKGGLSLFDLFRVVPIKEKGEIKNLVHLNMFCQNVVKDQVDYSRWLVGSLSGSDYAEESAIRFLNYTGESAEMNTTAAPIVYLGDSFYHLCHPERRRLSETRKRRACGPILTLGRYPDMCQSWMRNVELEFGMEKKSVLEHLRAGKMFHQLPWGQLSEEGYVGDFLLKVAHASGAFRTITDRNIELTGREGLLESGDELEKKNKSFQYAFSDWEGGKVVFAKEEGSGWEKREKWAQEWLSKIKTPDGLAKFAKEKWSPWFTFIIGLIYERHPDQKLPPGEIQSPSGIRMEKKILPSRRWHKQPQKAESGHLWNPNSVADLLEKCEEANFLTSTEIVLVKRICQL